MVLLFYVETTIYNLITVGLDIAWRMKVLFLAWLYLSLELKLSRIQRPQKINLKEWLLGSKMWTIIGVSKAK